MKLLKKTLKAKKKKMKKCIARKNALSVIMPKIFCFRVTRTI